VKEEQHRKTTVVKVEPVSVEVLRTVRP
jgi:hypothetical protein